MHSERHKTVERGVKKRFGFGYMQSGDPKDTSETIQTYLRRNEALAIEFEVIIELEYCCFPCGSNLIYHVHARRMYCIPTLRTARIPMRTIA
jgi:hypothetical protein